MMAAQGDDNPPAGSVVGPVWINGQLRVSSDGLSFLDHGFVVGDGAFEALLIHHGRPFAVTRHLRRLHRSLQALEIEPPEEASIRGGLEIVAASSGLETGRLRLTVTGGTSPLGTLRGDAGATVVIAATTVARPAAAESIVVCPWTRNERGALVGVKSTSYAENVIALRYARAAGAGEAIFANSRGELCEGTGTNIFLVLGDQLLTPALSSGCLAGVTRELVLELTDAVEADLPLGALAEATEIFLTSTSRKVQPVAAVGDAPVPSVPGPHTMAARDAYLRLLDQTLDP
ncbi:MAG: aminotransferase class IV [Acidimicrobiales bacterium]|jgi:branched-chain amino acid aminotransferase